ncbi:MAG: eIF2 kinase Gcn2p negative regulator [Claussenomyces sp. TS43310]|nr:MAG: eIF2 kinase Gcn2p negative regulator [Claussenomyces sp. TS43310]
MREDLENEVEALNSIYGDRTLEATDQAGVYVLHLPNQDASLRMQFPAAYPDAAPVILGTESSGESTRKGDAAQILEVFRSTVEKVWQPGEVCLYDAIEDVGTSIGAERPELEAPPGPLQGSDLDEAVQSVPSGAADESLDAPPWVLSEVVIELKSVFVARCAPVSSPDQAKRYLQHLLDHDRKVAKATHNMTAHRIQGKNGVTFQDCDDDGETAAGGRLLHLMQLMDLWDVMVVVTRWYGGHKLGPARFAIINSVARDAFVRGGFVQEDSGTSKKKGKR